MPHKSKKVWVLTSVDAGTQTIEGVFTSKVQGDLALDFLSGLLNPDMEFGEPGIEVDLDEFPLVGRRLFPTWKRETKALNTDKETSHGDENESA